MNIDIYKEKLEELAFDLKQFDSNKADKDYKILKQIFDVTYQSGVFDLTKIDKEELDTYKLELFKALTKVSGSLAFMAIQILAANAIMTKNAYSKKEYYIAKKCGIAINHLRAPLTIVSADKVDGGYNITGILTWASGYKIFDTLLIGFHSDGLEYEAMASFEVQDGFSIGNADETFVGYGLNTVDIELKSFFVKDEDIVSSNPIGNYTKVKSASKTVHFCIYALGNYALEYIKDEEFKDIAQSRLEDLQEKFFHSFDTEELDSLRIELFNLVLHIISTAMILNGGKSILANTNLQRLYKEMIMFNSNGLNDTLKQLFKSEFIRK